MKPTLRTIALLRLAAQRIAAPGLPSAAEAVRWLTAAQAQDYAGALMAIALRTEAGGREACGRAAVEAALDAGEVVRSWPMRGTLHLVAAEDLGWLLALTAERMLAKARRTHANLDIDDRAVGRATELAVDALTGCAGLRRDELMRRWQAGGVDTSGQRGYHLLWCLALSGTVCLGPVSDGEQRIVLADEWIRAPRRLDREQSLGELAARYFRGHGPATVKDFTRWTGLVAADVRAGLALARPDLASIDVDGIEYLLDPGTPELLDQCRGRARGVFLLPGFDEYMLGYGDRGAALPAEFADRIAPGGNGVFKPTVVAGGQVVGVWKHTGRGAKRTIEATPFTAFPARVAAAIPKVYAALP